jgi:hypothetical protein
MRSMLKLACLVLGATLACSAVAREEINEETLEATAGMLALPATTDGVLVVTMCGGCVPKSLQASSKTQYFLAQRAVTLAELTAYARTHVNAFAGVNYDTKTNALNRIRIAVKQ